MPGAMRTSTGSLRGIATESSESSLRCSKGRLDMHPPAPPLCFAYSTGSLRAHRNGKFPVSIYTLPPWFAYS